MNSHQRRIRRRALARAVRAAIVVAGATAAFTQLVSEWGRSQCEREREPAFVITPSASKHYGLKHGEVRYGIRIYVGRDVRGQS
jgi:hypothetical protein